jgi:hypothetical protein
MLPLCSGMYDVATVIVYQPILTRDRSLCFAVQLCSYYTLSQNGIVYSNSGKTSFTTVEQFEREYKQVFC